MHDYTKLTLRRRSHRLIVHRLDDNRGMFWVGLYPTRVYSDPLMTAIAEHAECRLSQLSEDRTVLWIGSAAFDVSAAEVAKIRETFDSLRTSEPVYAAASPPVALEPSCITQSC
jgi:hypothetical protein